MNTQTKEQFSQRVFGWLRAIGKLRDGLLILITGTYRLGYLVWSAHALQEGLGLLPAFEPQYFAAGVIPALLVWLTCVGFKAAKQLPERVVQWRDRQTSIWPARWRKVGAACVFGSIALFLFVARTAAKNPLGVSKRLYLTILASVLFVTGLLLSLAPLKKDPAAAPKRAFQFRFHHSPRSVRVIIYLYLAIYLVTLGALYLFGVYPNLPQEFGGVRPRCAYLDVVKDQVSESVRRDVLPAGAPRHPKTRSCSRFACRYSFRVRTSCWSNFIRKGPMRTRPNRNSSSSDDRWSRQCTGASESAAIIGIE